MEPIAIALVVSVMFNWWCFREAKTLQKDLHLVTEQNTILQINKDVKEIKDTPKLKSLGFVNVYKQGNGKHRISSIPQTKQYIRSNRKIDSVNEYIGTSEVFISTPEK